MGRFVQGEDRRQDYMLPASLDDYVSADNPVRAIEAFIDALDLTALEFVGKTPAETGRRLRSVRLSVVYRTMVALPSIMDN